mmetsp:Transcript_10509/g.39066  ORF Transcript_10509/g.39066 Transcript_10509/m.39066 type:complete len:227 (+) Transcript_10509:1040-1720(+)
MPNEPLLLPNEMTGIELLSHEAKEFRICGIAVQKEIHPFFESAQILCCPCDCIATSQGVPQALRNVVAHIHEWLWAMFLCLQQDVLIQPEQQRLKPLEKCFSLLISHVQLLGVLVHEQQSTLHLVHVTSTRREDLMNNTLKVFPFASKEQFSNNAHDHITNAHLIHHLVEQINDMLLNGGCMFLHQFFLFPRVNNIFDKDAVREAILLRPRLLCGISLCLTTNNRK